MLKYAYQFPCVTLTLKFDFIQEVKGQIVLARASRSCACHKVKDLVIRAPRAKRSATYCYSLNYLLGRFANAKRPIVFARFVFPWLFLLFFPRFLRTGKS